LEDKWYALHVRSRHERRVENSLTGKGYAVLSPFYCVKRQRPDRVVHVDLPLFPGYVFCNFDWRNRLPILKTPGVTTIVGNRNAGQPVEAEEIAGIRAMMDSGRPVQPWPFIRAGQRVRLRTGPLADTVGIYVREKNSSRLILSVTLLQRSVMVEVEQDSVEPLF
jgi:transcription antitermination factor NusG